MIQYFTANAPIRRKFDLLILLLGSLASIPLVVTFSGFGGLLAIELAEAVAVAALIGVMLIAKKLICDPYVTTVVRMEGLASGDVAPPIPYVHFEDCVGRMSRAMLIFRDNAKAREDADAALQDVIGEVTTALGHLRDGDLGYSISIRAALGEQANAISKAFNDATAALSAIMSKVADTAGNVLNGATEIRSASDDLAARTEQQAANLRDSALAMAEVTQMVQQTATNAGEVGTQVAEAHSAATDGGKVVHRAVAAMQAIQKSASEITNIIDVIDGIAFQTNLLALNAGVEAARAGDAGKGFAVVANEVRALAQRSAEAAKDIKELISASTASVSDGVALVDETGSVLLQIGDRVAAVNSRIAEISASVQVQASRLQQVNLAVGEMDKMTQQNAAMVEQSTAASRSLAEEANDLAKAVQRFSGGPAPARPMGSTPLRRTKPRPVSQTTGNLALQVVHDDADWSEF
ncbi:methyl-accepting chemotaxis protein [Blastomonas natatoria]|uniref:Methyl-accepting chemotaxis protein n=1 Tax=Blastomonas natatoria TaxID=34015 RepID=A0A2V3VCF4_9SPHN|nr:methyl-accepting chemotaxis protein [Blastomonas natatoria]PXW79397.1 methyl-accepting chemotaxis protein [Blastomonas natatoria]